MKAATEDDTSAALPPETQGQSRTKNAEDDDFATSVRWWPTFTALMRKNTLLLFSSKVQLMLVFLMPLMALSLVYAVQRITDSAIDKAYNDFYEDENSADIDILTSPQRQLIRPCAWKDVHNVGATRDCATILYAPPSAEEADDVNRIMEFVANEANLPFRPIPTDREVESDWVPSKWDDASVVGVPTVDHLGQFLVAHPGRAETVLHFWSLGEVGQDVKSGKNGTEPLGQPVAYFSYNESSSSGFYSWNPSKRSNDELLPPALERAFMILSTNKDDISIRIAMRDMFDNANTKTTRSTQDELDEKERQEEEQKATERDIRDTIVSFLWGPIFVFAVVIAAAMLSNAAAQEKSTGCVGSLRVVGMPDSAYWLSWWVVTSGIVIFPSTLLTMILAYIMNVALITDCAFLPIFLGMFFTYSLIYAVALLAVAIATNRPFLYSLYFVVLGMSVASVSMAFFPAGPADTVGKTFQYVFPGYTLGSIIQSIYRYNSRGGYDGEALKLFDKYGMAQFFQRLGDCNETILYENNTCVMVELYDDMSRACWNYYDCRGQDEEDRSEWCAPEECFFYPHSDFVKVLIMFVQTLVVLGLTWYIFQVIPSGNGLSHKPWFLVDPKYWMGSRGAKEEEVGPDQRTSADEQSIVIRGMTKVFGSATAVNRVDMDIPNGQVFVLLGHNGAGKTTLINMLTGKLAPTEGDAYVMGMSVKDNVHDIQRLVGSVPQHDLLWPNLSAQEHIRMFAKIKGVPNVDLDQVVQKILKKVHLTDAAQQAAGGYSGGMKRRLSIALAGIGGPKVIFMDEPTTGIDPLNRRRIWNLVRELKRNRVVVLTTHLMQEADGLGDHIAILDNGVVQAKGTPLNLKTEYGTGYSLSIVTDMPHVARVKELTQEKLPSVEVVNEAAGSLAFAVSPDEVSGIPNLTRQLQEEGVLREWSISQSTMEEVFLRLASESTLLQNRLHEMRNDENQTTQQTEQVSTDVTDDDVPLDEGDNAFGENVDEVFAPRGDLWRLQLSALFRKAFILRKRHWIASVIQLAIPIAMVGMSYKWLFEDLKVSQYETLLWPQATVSTGYSQYDQCDFEWSLWSDMGFDEVSKFTNSKAATSTIAFPSQNIKRNQPKSLSLRVSGLSGQSEEQVREALVAGMEYYLTRASKEEEQSAADTYCQGMSSEYDHCGACAVMDYMWELKDMDSDFVLFGLDNQSSYTEVARCLARPVACSAITIRFMLSQDSVIKKASEYLGLSSLTVDFYASELPSGEVGRFLSPPVIQLSNEDSSSRCERCPDAMGHVWVNGENAELFGPSLSAVSAKNIISKVIDEDIITAVQKNRVTLKDNSMDFEQDGNIDTSSCALVGAPPPRPKEYSSYYGSYYYGPDRSNDAGFISNIDGIGVFPELERVENGNGFSDNPFCSMSSEPLASYRELFPDAGITLSRFSILDKSVNFDATWILDHDYWWGVEKKFSPHEQSVYSVFCEGTDNATCNDSTSNVCVRAVAASGCEGSSYIDDDAVVSTTYKVLWASLGNEQARPIIDSVYPPSVRYHAAVTLDDIALFSFMTAVAVALVAPNLASVLVYEKNQRFVFTLLLNGLKMPTYWGAQYLIHFISAALLAFVSVILGVAFQLKVYVNPGPNYGLLFVALLTYIHAQFGFIVLATSLFKKERFAAVLVGFLVITLLGVAIIIHYAGTLHERWPLPMSVVPMFGFYRCLVLVYWTRYYSEFWGHIGVMLLSSTLYLVLGLYLQSAMGVGALYRLDCGILSDLFGNDAPPPTKKDVDDTDDVAEVDIAKEEHRALELDPSDTAIKVVNLGMTFPARPNPKHAVVDVTMAMDYGEIFGLLGPNGAGKTTVISMLVGQLTPSRGQAYVAGFDTVLDRRLALEKLGIVPQFDVYYPDLTVAEHLMMYAGMKGVKQDKQSDWARSIASQVGLGADDFFHRQAKALSGGMRRRLSIAVALLSNPRVLFLDEPTTGLDPEMKRSIWNIIERMRQDRCVILTTHAMDEAEALCNRIGIMAQGSLKCIGTQKELRARYGSTYELTFTVPKGTAKDDSTLEDYLTKQCPSTKVVSNYGETRVFTVDKSDMDLSYLFELIIHGGGDGHYVEWGINNTSLDEVFVAITAESEGVEAHEL